MRRRVIMLIVTVVAICGLFVATLLSDSRPVLGLDLQGGISIVLFPVKGTDLGSLNTAVNVIRNRIDGLGIAEPDVQRQGNTIVVNLPGVKDRTKAESIVGETAELRFRPVQYQGDSALVIPWTAKPAATTTTKPGASTTTIAGTSTTSTTAGISATTTTAAKTSTSGKAAGQTITTAPIAARFSVAKTAASTTTTAGATTTTAKAGTNAATSTTAKGATTTTKPVATPTTTPGETTCQALIKSSPADTDAAKSVVLPDRDRTSCYVLGPAIVTGKSVGSAAAAYNSTTSQWVTNVTFKNDDFVKKIAGPYVNKLVAIELDGVVQSAPNINPGITGRQVEISGNFTQGEAKDLALVLRYGALPVQFDQHKQTIESVSPTLGKDQLSAGIVSGLIGLGLVALYMLLYYRLLGLVVVAGLALTGMLFFTVISYLSSAHGLTLTLAGVTGIIVSVGVTVDSYVVYFERLKDEVRSGRTVRSSLEVGFTQSVPHDRRRRPRLLDRRRCAVCVRDELGEGLRAVPRHLDCDGPAARVHIHAPDGVRARAQPEAGDAARCRYRVRARRTGSGGVTSTIAPAEDIPGVTRRHRPSDFYHERTNFQFIKHSRRWAILSGTLLLLSVVLMFTRGLQFGIDFEGGTSWQVRMASGHSAKVAEVRDVLRPLGFSDAKVSILSGKNGQSVNVQEHLVADPTETIRTALADYGHVSPNVVQFAPAASGQGGTFTFTTAKTVEPTQADVEKVLGTTPLQGATVKVSGNAVTITAKTLPLSPTEKVARALATYAHATVNDVSISSVGPTWGNEVSHKAEAALVYFFLLLAVYLSVRFEAKMAAAAIIAVIHDIIFTVGVYALFQFAVTPATITAFLTILGFSLYDTVVVFDKVRENQRVLTATGRSTYGEMVNKSLNQVLMRSFSTSFVALMPVLSLLFVGAGVFGATSLEDFALALAAGLFIGSYSSIFVAAPLLAWWKSREPQYRALEERRRRVTTAAATTAAATVPQMSVESDDRRHHGAARPGRRTRPTRGRAHDSAAPPPATRPQASLATLDSRNGGSVVPRGGGTLVGWQTPLRCANWCATSPIGRARGSCSATSPPCSRRPTRSR